MPQRPVLVMVTAVFLIKPWNCVGHLDGDARTIAAQVQLVNRSPRPGQEAAGRALLGHHRGVHRAKLVALRSGLKAGVHGALGLRFHAIPVAEALA